jgi:hypothetical protein
MKVVSKLERIQACNRTFYLKRLLKKRRKRDMCEFFSCVSNGDGKALYFNAEQREKIRTKVLRYENGDSHTSIADFFGYTGLLEDKLNKYEFDPLTKDFTIDQLNNSVNDSEQIEQFCRNLDFKMIVPQLIIKPIIHPFTDIKNSKVTPEDLLILKQWASVWASVGDSVWASVRASVRESVRESVRASVRESVWASVGDSVRESVRASVWASVGDSVWASVRASVWAYISSFFDIRYPFDYSPCIKLWEKGLVPSFDGALWRVHGAEGKILWEGKIG